MYKASYAAGEKWFEFIKMGAGVYSTYRVNGDGSTTAFDQYRTKPMARKWVQFMNDNYATEGGRQKVFKMTEGEEFLSKSTFGKLNNYEGFPLCNIYKEPVLPDENDLCSLCHMHSASVTWNGKWATLEQLKITNNIPF